MGVYHIVFFRLKPTFEQTALDTWKSRVNGLVGVVPGLRYVDIGSPLPETAHRAKGFNVSVVAVLDKAEDAPVYAEHPAHIAIQQELRPKLFEEVVVVDMEFTARA